MSDIYIPGGNFSDEKMKILKDAKESAWRGLPKTAGFFMKEQDPYPSPYLNLSDYQIPRTMAEVFKWCRYFYKFDSLVGGAVNALARFPVTDIILEDMEALPENWDPKQDSPTLELYKQVFKDIRVNDELIKIGIDYYLYGNCFVFGEFEDFSDDPNMPDLRWARLFRLDPSKVTIDIDPLTQEKTYKWAVPAKIKRIVKERKPRDRYDAIPDIIKKAARENKAVILNSKNVYHFSREGESGDGSVWGTPLILNVMKQLAYRNLLRQAQEAIAREHIVPFRVYYLEPNERMDPQANWNNVASAFGAQLEKAAKDPNYKVVSPVPVNVLNLGGQGRALLLTPEIDQLQAEILAGMGVPREFIFGGVSYSAASISLRVLENQFITYRLLLTDFLNNFLIKRMAEVRGEWRGTMDNPYLIYARLADLKMQDDIQQKQMIINLNAANKVSDEYMYGMLGVDPDKMKAQIEIEVFERMERERRMQMFQLETEFMSQQIQMQMQMQLQGQFGPYMGGQPEPGQPEPGQPEPGQPEPGQPEPGQPEPGQPQNAERDDTKNKKNNNENTDNQKQDSRESKQEKKSFTFSTGVIDKPTYASKLQAEAVAKKIAHLGRDDKDQFLDKLSTNLRTQVKQALEKLGSNPNTVTASGQRNVELSKMREIDKVKALNQELPEIAAESNKHFTENAMQPLPENLPPRRKTLV